MRGARGVGGDGLRIELCGIRMHARARLHHVDEYETDDEGGRRDDLEVDDRPQADAADLLHVAHLRDADDDGAEDDRRNHHANQLHEAVAKRPHRRAEARVHLPQNDADDDAYDDLKPEAGVQWLLLDGGSSGHGIRPPKGFGSIQPRNKRQRLVVTRISVYARRGSGLRDWPNFGDSSSV